MTSNAKHRFRAASRDRIWTAVAVGLLLACGASGQSGQRAGSTSPDQRTQHYVALVHGYWIAYKVAEGDVPTFARVCWGGGISASAEHDPTTVDPAACRGIADAIIPPHEAFVKALGSTPAPAKFSRDDGVFRAQLPMAISDLTAMASAGAVGNRISVIEYMTNYYNDMIPKVTSALDDVDPTVWHI